MPSPPAPSNTSRSVGLDAAFLRRVHQADLGLTLLFGLLFLFAIGPRWALGFTALGLWSTANLWVLERLLREAIRPEGRDAVAIGVIAILKLPILYGGLVALLFWGDLPPVSVVLGLSVPMVVIFLKALGAVLARPTTPITSSSSTESRS